MDDETEIRRLVGAHFEAMRWGEGLAPDWDRFRADFLEGAVLFPAARPAAPRGVDGFVARMEAVARANLASFEEHTTRVVVHLYGNVAVALGLSEMLENGTNAAADVSGYLLVKTGGAWRIAAHGWDKVTPDRPLPPELG